MLLSRNNKNNVYPCKPQFYYIKVGFKGVKIIQACFRDVKLPCVSVSPVGILIQNIKMQGNWPTAKDTEVVVNKIKVV